MPKFPSFCFIKVFFLDNKFLSTLLKMNREFSLTVSSALLPRIYSFTILENSVPIFIGSTFMTVPPVAWVTLPRHLRLTSTPLMPRTLTETPLSLAYYPTFE